MNVRELRDLLGQLDSRQRILAGTADGSAVGQPHLDLLRPERGLRGSPVMLYAYPAGYEPDLEACDCLLCKQRRGAPL